MRGRWVFAAGLLVGSTTGAFLTAAGLRDRPAPEPAPALAPAQQVERIPIDITCAPEAEPTTTEEPADG